VLFSVLAVTGFYLLGSYAQVAGFHFNLDALGKAAGAPLFALASPGAAGGYGSVTLVRLMELVVVLDMLAVLLGCATAGSRGLFAMARDGRLPAPLAAVSKRGTPLTAGLTVMAGYVVAVVVTTQWGSLWASPGVPHYAAMFSVLATFGSFSLACVYFLLSLGAFRGLADHRRRYAVVLAAVVGMLVTGAAIFGAVYKVSGPVAWVPVPAAAVFLIGLATRRRAVAGESSPSLKQVAGAGAGDA
jgi:amino acid transporter